MSKRSPRLLFTQEELAAPELKKAIRKADQAHEESGKGRGDDTQENRKEKAARR